MSKKAFTDYEYTDSLSSAIEEFLKTELGDCVYGKVIVVEIIDEL